MRMPDLSIRELCKGLSDSQADIIRACFKRNGGLRASKPFKKIDYSAPDALFKGSVNYVWRMICFDFCDFRPHVCMPVCADFDIGVIYMNYERKGIYTKEERREKEKEYRNMLDELIKKAESNLPITMQKGALRWGQALGLV
mgnify:CR=1 FL=1